MISTRNIVGIILGLSLASFGGYKAWAEPGVYAGVSYGTINTDITDHVGSTLYAGIQFNEWVGIEGRALVASSVETYDSVDLEINSLYGIYLTAAVPVGDSASIYFVVGQTEGEVTASYMGYSASAEESSASYGGGVKFHLRENWTVKAEYLATFEDVDQFSIGLQYNFK